MEADGGALCIDTLIDKTGQEISFHRRGSIDCGAACSKLAYWNSIEHASPETSRPVFPVSVDTYLESSHTTMMSPPVVCNVAHRGWIATTLITVFIPLFLPLHVDALHPGGSSSTKCWATATCANSCYWRRQANLTGW